MAGLNISPVWRWVLGIVALLLVGLGIGLYVMASHLNPIVRARALDMIRMTNISILPGETPLTLEQLIADTDDGIYMRQQGPGPF